jgi:hypothetical protein
MHIITDKSTKPCPLKRIKALNKPQQAVARRDQFGALCAPERRHKQGLTLINGRGSESAAFGTVTLLKVARAM